MIIERTENEVIFKFSGNINVDDLQDIADFLEFAELANKSKATQNEVDALVKTVKKGRWDKTKSRLGL
ncbi:hypothetical protein [Adhaeribacter pallidiroseus]|uniref:Uncharacterized protein n=1 Tax=Adhaeribacter pallidiroseus TaxID=2072847 RepID=A0A369QRQ8_9BACT|nr:hypothetical protein [Adhaeribacter pallidiroseus]RDC64868.1 hypothetical protein AHMF7616_03490 [Adhaeribacter pallidiroseus]